MRIARAEHYFFAVPLAAIAASSAAIRVQTSLGAAAAPFLLAVEGGPLLCGAFV
jgi:hypothetical protein